VQGINGGLEIALQSVRLLLTLRDRLLHAADVDLDPVDCRARAVDSIQQPFKAVHQRLAALQNQLLLGLQCVEGGKKKVAAVLRAGVKRGMTLIFGSSFPTNRTHDKNSLEIRSFLMAKYSS
jgi:hypothetical protein